MDLVNESSRTGSYVTVLSPPSSPPLSVLLRERDQRPPARGPLPRLSIPRQRTERTQQALDNAGVRPRRAAALHMPGTARLRAGGRPVRFDGARVAAWWHAAPGVGRDRVAGFVIRNGGGKCTGWMGTGGTFLGGDVVVCSAGGCWGGDGDAALVQMKEDHADIRGGKEGEAGVHRRVVLGWGTLVSTPR